MSSKTIEALQKAFAANALDDIELLEISNGFVVVKLKLDDSLHEFRIHESENVTRLIFDYMDFHASLEGTAVQIELNWNMLAFKYSVITRLLQNHEEGLTIFADFRYSPLLANNLWENELRAAGLYIVKDLGSNSDYIRHVILAIDPLLAP